MGDAMGMTYDTLN